MNRSFRGPEALMPSIKSSMSQLKSQQASMRERDEDLTLFLEMRKCEKEKTDLLFLQDSDEFDQSLVSQPGSLPPFDIPSSMPARKPCADDFLNSDSEKNDYDWLLTPPDTPLFPSLEMESRKAYMNDSEAPKPQPTVLRSRFANSQTETTVKSSLVPIKPTASGGLTSSASGIHRPSSSGGPGSRPVTPTGRPILTSARCSRPSTPTSRPRATLPSAKSTVHSSLPKPAASSKSTRSTTSTASTKSTFLSRSSTPSRTTARPSAPSNGPSRSSTPSRSMARSSTPTRCTARSSTPAPRTAVPASRSTAQEPRPTVPASRPTSRASTPCRPSTPSSTSGASAMLNKSSSSISSQSGSAPSKNPVPSRGASPTVRSRPWNPSEMPGFSLEAPPNLRTTLPDRPLSATRGRPMGPSARSSSIEPVSNNNGRQKRQSCSPSRGRAPNGGSTHSSGSSVPAVSRGRSSSRVSDNDKVNPVVIGTKMVERVINMRKLAPPGQNDKHSPSLSGKSASSPDSSGGFGRTLSKKSLDMAIRHMDLRQTIPGNLRPLMTKIPASSMYSVRSGPTGSRTTSVSDSPLATSSTASSEFSVNNNHAFGIDGHGSDLEYDLASDRGGQLSLTTIRGR